MKDPEKVLIVDFKNIDTNEYKIFSKAKKIKTSEYELTKDGKILINKRGVFRDLLFNAFAILLKAGDEELEKLRTELEKKFPKVKTPNDIAKVHSDSRWEAFVYTVIPVELKRREIEKNYNLI